ncbi:DUF3450 domain-containing protein [Motiliproteus sp. MSK22-1]|uniref:DUF3450 domain-containing protein n=1 Tax=Motiliproteus sp. MSK22-1 TaxID=1897630 RepID=UPI000978657B|nr:DUF3450 domain-containing protein [Motiliproteus sp. MSK22-1]OMH33674.1 hypothetical protein BGP75_11750 [Motiliproteus sp. MSK22-1]
MNLPIKKLLLSGLLSLSAIAPAVVLAADLTSSEKQASANHKVAKQSQQRIDSFEDSTRAARDEYLNNERMSGVTEAYNRQIMLLVKSQEDELADLDAQLQSIEETDQAVLPMLSRMVEMLHKFVAADLPFLNEERQKRLAKLDALLLRADVSVAEKYRQILEAYMVEVQYGRTFEAYSGRLDQEGSSRQVNFLRLGRTGLYYQTLSGQESALWQPAQKRWLLLSEEQNLTLRKAIQIAQQQQVPSLIDLPLPALESRS